MKSQTDTYQRILESAQTLIHASSYSEVGVAAICEEAKVKKGSFYHFFESKQDLTLAVIDKTYADMKENLLNQAFSTTLAPLDRLERFIDLAIEMQTKIYQQTGHIYGCPFGNLATELATQNESIRTKLDTLFMTLQELIRTTLQDAVNKNELNSINVELTAQAIVAYFEGTMMLAKTHNDPDLLKQLLPAALNIHL